MSLFLLLNLRLELGEPGWSMGRPGSFGVVLVGEAGSRFDELCETCMHRLVALEKELDELCQNLGASNRTPVQTRQDTIDVDRC